MNRKRTREVLDKLGIRVMQSNAHGVEIERLAKPSRETLIKQADALFRVRTHYTLGLTGLNMADPKERQMAHTWMEIFSEVEASAVPSVTERWRLMIGGGIAGNSDKVWLSPLARIHGQSRGPFCNKTQLEKALRAWRRGE